MRHLVVCASQLEAEDGQEIFPLEKNIAFEPLAEVVCRRQGGLVGDFVYSGGKDQPQILEQRSE
jgi:hypothetical protein